MVVLCYNIKKSINTVFINVKGLFYWLIHLATTTNLKLYNMKSKTIQNFIYLLTELVDLVYYAFMRILIIATALGAMYLAASFFFTETQHVYNRLSAVDQVVEIVFTMLIPGITGIGFLIWGILSPKEDFLESINFK